MADTTFSNGTVVEADWLNDVNDTVYPGTPAPGTVRHEVFGRTAAEIAAGVTPTNYAYPPGYLFRYLPAAELAAIRDGSSTYDCTTAVNACVLANTKTTAPAGVYHVNPDTGVLLRTGVQIIGEGRNKTVFVASAQGGTSAELVSYTKGSLFKRQFNVSPGTNSYIVDVLLSDFSVILNHPTGSVTATEIQIGIDLRNITRSRVERVHVGNITPLDCLYVKADPGSYAVQGYGVVLGSVSQSDPSYCGGEVNTIRDCSVWGAYKGIVQDDLTLSPSSAAHATVVENCDIQACNSLLAQESQYAAGFTWSNNVLQNTVSQPGGGGGSRYVMRIAGYGNEVVSGYIEAGSTDYLLRFDSASKTNKVRLSHYGATSIGISAFSDAGTNNTVHAYVDTGSSPGGVDSLGAPVTRFNRAYASVWQKFHWDGAAIVVSGGFGITVTRTGTGDYLATYTLPFLSADSYTVSIALDTNASGHGGTFSILSQGTTNTRFVCYGQNGGTTTAIDPRNVYIRVTQGQS